MIALSYTLAFIRNLALYGRLTVWVALPRDGYWFDDARVWFRRGFIPYNSGEGAQLELKPQRSLWREWGA